jgi:hypothetical protein
MFPFHNRLPSLSACKPFEKRNKKRKLTFFLLLLSFGFAFDLFIPRFVPLQVLSLAWIPALRTRFLNYGPPGSSTRNDAKQQRTSRSLLDRLGSVNVTHGLFWHFYALSVALSAFWAARFLTLSSLWTGTAAPGRWPYEDGLDRSGMNMHQVILLWALLSVQGGRRLYECFAFTRSSRSTMWIGHYVWGLLYYSVMSVAVWVEGRGLQPASLVLSPRESWGWQRRRRRC